MRQELDSDYESIDQNSVSESLKKIREIKKNCVVVCALRCRSWAI